MFNIVELNATVDELKPINEAITKDFEASPPSSTEPSKENHVNSKKDLSLTKEVEIAPVINDPSLKLNRTFRKMVVSVEKQNFSIQTATSNLVTTTMDISKPIVSTFSTPIHSNVTEEEFDGITEEPKKPNRKRVLSNEKKNGYPYYIGRVLG